MSVVVTVLSTRPNEHFERDQCLEAAHKLLKKEGLDAKIANTIQQIFLPEAVRWQAAREAHVAADAVAVTIGKNAGEAATRFIAATRRWVGSIRDMDGKTPHKEVAWLLGGRQPSKFIELPLPELVSESRDVLVRLPRAPHLGGDPDLFAAFRTAHDALSTVVGADGISEKTEDELKLALDKAARQFDLAWGILVRVVQKIEGREQARVLLPVFHRTRKAKGPPEDEAPTEVPEGGDDSGVEAPVSETEPSEAPAPPRPSDPKPLEPKVPERPEPSRPLVAPTQPPSS